MDNLLRLAILCLTVSLGYGSNKVPGIAGDPTTTTVHLDETTTFQVECIIKTDKTREVEAVATYIPRIRKFQNEEAYKDLDYSDSVVLGRDSCIIYSGYTKETPENEETGFASWDEVGESRFNIVLNTVEKTTIDIEYKLTITELKATDSGVYVCEIGTYSNPIDHQAHTLHIYRQSETLQMYTKFNGEPSPLRNTITGETYAMLDDLIYFEDTPGYFECNATGGSPEPSLQVHITDAEGGDDHTIGTTHMTSVEYRGTIKCHKQVLYTVSAYNTEFKQGEDSDSKIIKCIAKTTKDKDEPSTYDQTDSKTLLMWYRPKFTCDKVQNLAKGGKKGQLMCVIDSYPEVYNVTWKLKSMKGDENDITSIKAIDGLNYDQEYGITADLLAIAQDDTTNSKASKMRAQLTFDEVAEKHLTVVYVVIAQNEVGREELIITVQDGKVDVAETTGGSAGVRMSYVLVCLVSILALWL
jgi:hypothetical protein